MSKINRHQRQLNELALLAETVDVCGQSRHAASLVYHGEVISLGINRSKSHPFQKRYSHNDKAIFLHAENDCLSGALSKYPMSVIAESTMYVTRVKYEDTFKTNGMIVGMSRPCRGCQRALAAFNVKKVCYTTEDGSFEWL